MNSATTIPAQDVINGISLLVRNLSTLAERVSSAQYFVAQGVTISDDRCDAQVYGYKAKPKFFQSILATTIVAFANNQKRDFDPLNLIRLSTSVYAGTLLALEASLGSDRELNYGVINLDPEHPIVAFLQFRDENPNVSIGCNPIIPLNTSGTPLSVPGDLRRSFLETLAKFR